MIRRRQSAGAHLFVLPAGAAAGLQLVGGRRGRGRRQWGARRTRHQFGCLPVDWQVQRPGVRLNPARRKVRSVAAADAGRRGARGAHGGCTAWGQGGHAFEKARRVSAGAAAQRHRSQAWHQQKQQKKNRNVLQASQKNEWRGICSGLLVARLRVGQSRVSRRDRTAAERGKPARNKKRKTASYCKNSLKNEWGGPGLSPYLGGVGRWPRAAAWAAALPARSSRPWPRRRVPCRGRGLRAPRAAVHGVALKATDRPTHHTLGWIGPPGRAAAAPRAAGARRCEAMRRTGGVRREG